jgi:hypothetical protein
MLNQEMIKVEENEQIEEKEDLLIFLHIYGKHFKVRWMNC